MSSLPTPKRLCGHSYCVACYARVSTEDQAEQKTIDAQIDFLRRYCELHGLHACHFYVDDGISGTTAVEDRPEGRRLLDDADDGLFDAVLVYRIDRLGRSLKSLIAAHDRLERAGVAITSGTEPIDTTNPIGKFVFNLLGSMAELEKSTITERLTLGRDRLARQEKYTGGPIPFGYDLDADRCLVPSARLIQVLEITEAELVRDIYGRIARGETTMNAECNRLTALGIPRLQRYAANRKKGTAAKILERSGGWGLSSLGVILHNATYKGAGLVESKYGDVERPAPALIDAETWERVQQVLVKNRNQSKRGSDHEYLLRGLVKCGECGLTFGGAPNGGVRKYRCNSNSGRADRHPKRCVAGQVDAARLEALVWEEVREFVRNPGPYIEDAQRELRDRLVDVSKTDDRRKELTRDLAGKEQERERVLDLFRRGRINAAECDRDLDKVAAETREIRELLDALRTRAEMAAASEAYLSDVGASLALLRDKMDEIERANDRAAMRDQIALLAPGIVIHTEVLGMGKVKKRTQATLKLTLAFGQTSAALPITKAAGGRKSSRSCEPAW